MIKQWLLLSLFVCFVFGQAFQIPPDHQKKMENFTLSTGDLKIPSSITLGKIPKEYTKQIIENRAFECEGLEEEFTLDPDLAKPDFFFIGVAKSGSTSLHYYLGHHPQVKLSKYKEPNFFTFPFVMQMTPEKYGSLFTRVDPEAPRKPEEKISGEFSTSYVAHPLAARRIYSQLPKSKIILFLRNPVDRAYSHYVMQLRGAYESQSFERVIEYELEEFEQMLDQFRYCWNLDECSERECIPDIPVKHHKFGTESYIVGAPDLKKYLYTSYLMRGIYYDAVERYLTLFPREQILIINSERFYDDAVGVLHDICDFLEIERKDWGTITDKTFGGGPSNYYGSPHSYTPMDPDTYEKLSRFYAPWNEKLFKLIGERFDW